ncbi:MAG: YMGG-like glycine zipper-containing protein [Dongiaceae bacterium]
MNRILPALCVTALLSTAGCTGLNSTEQSMLSGGAIGAGSGAVVGALTGGLGVATGAAIGAAAGVAAGYIIDQAD